MSGFLMGFAGAMLGGVLTSIAVGWLESRFRMPANTYPDDPVENFPGSLIVRIGAVSVACAWLCLLTLLLLITWALVADRLLAGVRSDHLERLVVRTLGVFLGIGLLYTSVAFTARCSKCRGHVFVQWTRKPPFTERVLGLDARAVVAVNILVRGRFRCMYCGQRYSTAPNSAVKRPGSPAAEPPSR